MTSIGDVVKFNYPAVHQQGTRAHDKTPTVLILHPEYSGLMHGLNFNYLTEDEINLIRMILSPKFQLNYKAALARRNPGIVKEFDTIMEVAGSTTILSPQDFYQKTIRPFIMKRQWDPYRLYRPEKITNLTIVEPYSTMSGETPEGIFQKFARKFAGMRGPRLPSKFRR